MTGAEMTLIRRQLNLGRRSFARCLGYEGSAQTNFKVIARYEIGTREIPVMTARRVRALKEHFETHGTLPEFVTLGPE